MEALRITPSAIAAANPTAEQSDEIDCPEWFNKIQMSEVRNLRNLLLVVAEAINQERFLL